MILCSCLVLTRTEIEAAARALAASEPGRAISPARVFLKLGVRAQCGSCAETVRLVLRDLGLPSAEAAASDSEEPAISSAAPGSIPLPGGV